MQTIQRNFVTNLNNSGLSMERKYKQVKNFLNKEPEVVRVLGLKEDHYSFCIDTDTVRKVRNYLHATKSVDHKGHVKYDVWEDGEKLFG